MRSACTRKGFSIGEVLISSFVIMMGVVVTSNLLATSITSTTDGRNLVIASQLAQEGAELVRNVRDNNVVNGSLSFVGFPSNGSTRECSIDYASGLSCSSSTTLLRYDNGFYEHGSGEDTFFRRRIRISVSGSGEEADVESTVVWRRTDFPSNCTFGDRCVSTRSTLTTWLEP
ncbi:MAG TPA: hypothetical protein VJL38_03185 [Patescibacteria group bacterium]|nr:hypothetical protein [Patescibacteria group bacterium]